MLNYPSRRSDHINIDSDGMLHWFDNHFQQQPKSIESDSSQHLPRAGLVLLLVTSRSYSSFDFERIKGPILLYSCRENLKISLSSNPEPKSPVILILPNKWFPFALATRRKSKLHAVSFKLIIVSDVSKVLSNLTAQNACISCSLMCDMSICDF